MATLSSLASIVPEPSVSKRSNASRISCFCSSERPEVRPLPLVRVVPTYSCQNKQPLSVRAKSQQLARRRNCIQCNRRAQFSQPTPPPSPNARTQRPHSREIFISSLKPRTRANPRSHDGQHPPFSVQNARSVDASTIHDRRPAPAPRRATPRLAPAPHRTPPQKLHRASPSPARRDPRVCARARRCAPRPIHARDRGNPPRNRARDAATRPARAAATRASTTGRNARQTSRSIRVARTMMFVAVAATVCGRQPGDVRRVRVRERGCSWSHDWWNCDES